MKRFKQRLLLVLAMMLVAGCVNLSDLSQSDQVSSTIDKTTIKAEDRRVIPDALIIKNSASIRMGGYVDARMMGNPRKVGTGKVNAFGMAGKDVILDQDIADMVAGAMKKRLQEAGFKVIEERDASALFELSGKVKELLYSVKARDEVSIEIETTLKNVTTGKIVWAGVVVEKNDHFSGVPRVTNEDVGSFLSTQLDIISEKTLQSITDGLMISNPELFNPAMAIKPIPGVTVLVAPVAPVLPAVSTQATVGEGMDNVAITPPVYQPSAKATSGMLAIVTKPARAKVYIDGVYHGLTPFWLEMEAGLYGVSIKLEGYQMIVENVIIRRKNITEMDLTLER